MTHKHEMFLRIKEAPSNDGERWIHAWASTPDEDLAGDRINPFGAVYELPIPLLAYHKTDSPVGVVTEAHATERGIRVKARLTRGVKLADECWALIRDGAIAAVSVGFRAIKTKPLPSGGLLFESFRWIELSLTPTPCNVGAKIYHIGKAIAYATTPATPEPRLPQYVPCGDLAEDFARATRALPQDARRAVSDLTSTKTAGRWALRDRHGAVVAMVPPPVPPAAKRVAEVGLTKAQRAEVRKMLNEASLVIARGVGRAIRKSVGKVHKSSEQATAQLAAREGDAK